MATLYWPFPTSKVSEWPGRRSGSYHYGTDFAIPHGTPLRASIDGVITRHNNDGLGAYVLDIMSDDGLLIRNGHLSRMDVQSGQRVRAGDVIGLTGGTPGTPGAGYSFGAHLHWELRRDRKWSGGAWIDPRNLNPQPSTFGAQPAPQPIDIGENEMTVIIANEQQPGIFAVVIDGEWKELRTGRKGEAELEALDKIAAVENGGAKRPWVRLTGEQFAAVSYLYRSSN